MSAGAIVTSPPCGRVHQARPGCRARPRLARWIRQPPGGSRPLSRSQRLISQPLPGRTNCSTRWPCQVPDHGRLLRAAVDLRCRPRPCGTGRQRRLRRGRPGRRTAAAGSGWVPPARVAGQLPGLRVPVPSSTTIVRSVGPPRGGGRMSDGFSGLPPVLGLGGVCGTHAAPGCRSAERAAVSKRARSDQFADKMFPTSVSIQPTPDACARLLAQPTGRCRGRTIRRPHLSARRKFRALAFPPARLAAVATASAVGTALALSCAAGERLSRRNRADPPAPARSLHRRPWWASRSPPTTGRSRAWRPRSPTKGKRVKVTSKRAKAYRAYLERQQDRAAARVGAEADKHYAVSLNGFGTTLTAGPGQVR